MFFLAQTLRNYLNFLCKHYSDNRKINFKQRLKSIYLLYICIKYYKNKQPQLISCLFLLVCDIIFAKKKSQKRVYPLCN